MSARRCSILLHETEQKKQTDGFFCVCFFSVCSPGLEEMETVDHEVPEELFSHLRIVLERLNCRGTQTHDSSSTIVLGSLGEPESEELRGVLKRLETEG